MNTCKCGKEVRLRGFRTSDLWHDGIYSYIEHRDGTRACGGDWDCLDKKPYPKDETKRESSRLVSRWNEANPETVRDALEGEG